MNRGWKTLLVLLGTQAGLSGVAATLEWTYSCGACRVGGLSLGLVGLAFYCGLFISALVAGPSRIVFGALFLGFGIHAMLVVQLISLGQLCWICLTATAISGVMTALAIGCDRANLVRLAGMLPWSALLVLGWSELPGTSLPEPVFHDGGVTLVIYTQEDCHFCDTFRDDILPRARKEFGDRIRVRFRSADEVATIRLTPTILVVRGDSRSPTRVFEGIPPYPALRRAILEAEARS